MKADCATVSDAIWEACRTGVPFSKEVLEHVGSCADCASAIAAARAGLSALECVPRNPVAPDCRSAVWDRVTQRRTRLLPAWTYACVIVIATLTIVGTLPWGRGQRPASQPARRNQAVVRESLPPVKNRPVAPPVRIEKPRRPIAAATKAPDSRRHLPGPRPRRPRPHDTAAKPREHLATPVQAPPAEQSSMLASVTWSLGGQKDSYRCSYTLTDSTTGDITKCSVRRDGDSVEITMESEPTDPGTEHVPIKETKSNEAHRWS